ncbi:MAG: alpha/beta hydrolase [Cyanobacteria bacterium P01_D01_bin.1]
MHDHNLLWLSVSPRLKGFDRRLLSQLAKTAPVRKWEYIQTVDEPCCLDSIVEALHEYVCDRANLERRSGNPNYKVHLLGHGVSGVVALMYARCYPERVASLSLLSVNAKPAVNWQAHYYAIRQLLPCSRDMVLAQMTRLLFGQQPRRLSKPLAELLSADLDSAISLHSLAHDIEIPTDATAVPLLVCNGEQDPIVQAQEADSWQHWMKPGDCLWQCPNGHHFFQFHHAKAVAEAILEHVHHAETMARSADSDQTVKSSAHPQAHSAVEATAQ